MSYDTGKRFKRNITLINQVFARCPCVDIRAQILSTHNLLSWKIAICCPRLTFLILDALMLTDGRYKWVPCLNTYVEGWWVVVDVIMTWNSPTHMVKMTLLSLAVVLAVDHCLIYRPLETLSSRRGRNKWFGTESYDFVCKSSSVNLLKYMWSLLICVFPVVSICLNSIQTTEGWPGWVDLGGLLHSEMVYLSVDRHASK